MIQVKKCEKPKKMETSKKILAGSWAATIVLTLAVIVLSFVDKDATNVTILAGSAWAELTAAHGFYYWKAKNENRAKGAQRLIKKLADQHGIDAAAQFAEIIYKD